MNLVRIAIILILGLIPICCKTKSNEIAKRENHSANNKNSLIIESKYSITEKGVLGFFIGDSIPEQFENYKLIKSVKIVEEGNEESRISVIENNTELLQLSLEYDQKSDHFNNRIGEILIKDKRLRTEKNIGVESTITEFINSYPNYYLWYTYVSGMYVIQLKGQNIQFLLDPGGYIGKENLLAGDMIKLKKEDFLSDTKIVAIRIY